MKFIFGKKKVVVGVNILSEPDPPELTTEDSCLPPYPYDFDDATNTGFKIETLLTIGKSTCNGKNKYYPLIQNPATLEKSRIGLAIVKVSTCKFGRWEYKDGGAFRNVDVRGKCFVVLFRNSSESFYSKRLYNTVISMTSKQSTQKKRIVISFRLSSST